VERCVAVGVTPDSPSWYDYLLGKNRAKLLSVKVNIKNTYSAFVKPYTNMGEFLDANFTNGLTFTNDSDLLTYCGLPTNTLDETPYFKSQYDSTTGGWFSCYVILTNEVWTKRDIEWSPWAITNKHLPTFRVWWHVETEGVSGPDKNLDLSPSYYYGGTQDDMYVWGVHTTYFWENPHYVWAQEDNARGSWTTFPDSDTWATNADMCVAGYTNSFLVATNLGGFSWPIAMKQYPVWTKPQEVGSFSRHRIGYAITTNTTGTNAIDHIYEEPYIDYEFITYTSYWSIVNTYTTETNYNVPVTNLVVSSTNFIEVSSNYFALAATNINLTTNRTVYSDEATIMFAGIFAGSRGIMDRTYWTVADTFSVATNLPRQFTTNVPAQTYNYTEVPTNITVIRDVTNQYSVASTSEVSKWVEVEKIDIWTNYVFVATSSVPVTNNGTLKYTCGAVTVAGYPYIRSYQRVDGDWLTNTVATAPTNAILPFERVIDYWIVRENPTNMVTPELTDQWNGYNTGASDGWGKYVKYDAYSTSGYETNEYAAVLSDVTYTWPYHPDDSFAQEGPWSSVTSEYATVSGKLVGGAKRFSFPAGENPYNFLSDEYMMLPQSLSNAYPLGWNVFYSRDKVASDPSIPNFTFAHGWQTGRSIAIERWNATTNGFKYR
jgi:hypothetical protein